MVEAYGEYAIDQVARLFDPTAEEGEGDGDAGAYEGGGKAEHVVEGVVTVGTAAGQTAGLLF